MPFCAFTGACLEEAAPALTGAEAAKALQEKAVRGMEKLLFHAKPYHLLVAGMHQFAESWSRDVCHASIGILEKSHWNVDGEDVPSTKIVSDTVLSFLEHVTPTKTLAPRVVDSFRHNWLDVEHMLKYKVVKGSLDLTKRYFFGKDINKQPAFPHYPFQAMYQGESGTVATIDSNFMILLAFARYAEKVGQIELVKYLNSDSKGYTVSEKLRLVLGYYSEARHWKCMNGKFFVQQGKYQEWKDSLRQVGVSSFTNLQIIETIEMLLQNNNVVNALEGAKLYSPRFGVETLARDSMAVVKSSLLQWKRDIVAEFLLPNGLLQEVETVSNMSHMDAHLTWFRIAHEKEFENTINFEKFVNHFVIRDSDGNIISVSGTADGRYWPRREVAGSKNLIGLADYHGTMTWTWLLGYFIGLVGEHGYTKLQDELLNWCLVTQTRMKKLGFDEYISEIYSSGEIVHNLLYTSETPFMWGSSYIMWATSKILKDADDEVVSV